MLYAQLSTKKSLRDLVFSLDRHRQKLYHLGLTPAKRSTLAEANEKRPALIFKKTYEKLLARFQAEAGVGCNHTSEGGQNSLEPQIANALPELA